MKIKFLFIFLSIILTSCGSSHKTTSTSRTTSTSFKKKSNKKAKAIVKYAKTFEGTRYKFGGTTKKGMDCSGLVYVAYRKEGITLPRISRDMAKEGKTVSLKKIAVGDLLFFKTNKNTNTINHVGLVVENNRGEIFFIHSTTSLGVIISSIEERYWKNAFVEVRRVI